MDSVSNVGVVDKVVALLDVLRDGASSLGELQARSGVPRATAHRLAVALEDHGLVRRRADGRFVLGQALVALGRAAADAFPLTELARPVLRRLRDETGESTQLFVREGDGRRCLVSLQSSHGLRWIVAEGALLPLDRGSAGRVLLGQPDAYVESVEEREPGVASVSAPVRRRHRRRRRRRQRQRARRAPQPPARCPLREAGGRGGGGDPAAMSDER